MTKLVKRYPSHSHEKVQQLGWKILEIKTQKFRLRPLFKAYVGQKSLEDICIKAGGS